MNSKIQTIDATNWYDEFSCIGGSCPLTCCDNKRWTINIDDESLNNYNNLSDDFSGEVKHAIDFDSKVFKNKHQAFGDDSSAATQCALLTDEGWCKIVLNYGDNMLCRTCQNYPRSLHKLNNHFDQLIDITCPEVAKRLIDGSPFTYQRYEVPYFAETAHIDSEIFDAIMDTRDFLLDIFLSVDGFVAGKCFIAFDIINGIQSIIDSGHISAADFNNLFSKYSSEETIASVLEECEHFNRNAAIKAQMATIAIQIVRNILQFLAMFCSDRLPDFQTHLQDWQNLQTLQTDMTEFYEYRDSHFPKFVDTSLAYRLFTDCLTDTPADYALSFKVSYMMILMDEILAMSMWKSNDCSLAPEDLAYLLSTVERGISHSNSKLKALRESIATIESATTYSFFMMPVY